MVKLLSLQLFVLQQPELEQAAWVRADTPEEASKRLSSQTGIPVIISNKYEWILFPDNSRHEHNENRPFPHWEYRSTVSGPADLKGMPEFIRVLSKHTPRRQGQIVVGQALTRSTPIDLRSIPATPVADVQVFHSGYRTAYSIAASQMLGYQKNWASIDIGKVALIEFVGEKANYPEAGDIVRVALKGSNDDYFVTGRVVGKFTVVDVVDIRKSNRWSARAKDSLSGQQRG